jgi:hypothetical protein
MDAPLDKIVGPDMARIPAGAGCRIRH